MSSKEIPILTSFYKAGGILGWKMTDYLEASVKGELGEDMHFDIDIKKDSGYKVFLRVKDRRRVLVEEMKFR